MMTNHWSGWILRSCQLLSRQDIVPQSSLSELLPRQSANIFLEEDRETVYSFVNANTHFVELVDRRANRSKLFFRNAANFEHAVQNSPMINLHQQQLWRHPREYVSQMSMHDMMSYFDYKFAYFQFGQDFTNYSHAFGVGKHSFVVTSNVEILMKTLA